ncbi:MAG: hypothetical protein ACUVTR_07035 [Dehalococcoidia bacterium]
MRDEEVHKLKTLVTRRRQPGGLIITEANRARATRDKAIKQGTHAHIAPFNRDGGKRHCEPNTRGTM